MAKKRIKTDRQVLQTIYEHYLEAFTTGQGSRGRVMYVPIDIPLLAQKLGMDTEILFGRLYFHLEKRHGFTNDDGSKVALFTPVAGQDRNCIQFPLLTAILADLQTEDRRHVSAMTIAIVSLVLSVVSIGLTFAGVG